jgi:hypothetical protein
MYNFHFEDVFPNIFTDKTLRALNHNIRQSLVIYVFLVAVKMFVLENTVLEILEESHYVIKRIS